MAHEADDVHQMPAMNQYSHHAERIAMFWNNTLNEIEESQNIDFKEPGLPFARIKKIMKSDEDVRVSAY